MYFPTICCTIGFTAAFALLFFSGCGASTDTSQGVSTAKNTAPSFSWDQVCQSAAERLQRCPEEVKVDGPFAERCTDASHDRACFDTFNAKTGAFLMNCIHQSRCDKKGSIFENCATDLFTKAALASDEQARQDRCQAHMKECKLPFEERCIAPFLKEPLADQVWQCVEMPCAGIRRCTESVLEKEGCQ